MSRTNLSSQVQQSPVSLRSCDSEGVSFFIGTEDEGLGSEG